MRKVVLITVDANLEFSNPVEYFTPIFTEEEPQNETEEEPKEEGVWSKIQEMDYYDGTEWD
jgi:hypothetical protein